jgi:hypothetical protein
VAEDLRQEQADVLTPYLEVGFSKDFNANPILSTEDRNTILFLPSQPHATYAR